ncbi:hypothetical protein BD626DRAFT_516853 [Schizophyllum amplum]|uniref:Glucose-methanol-choline oxidoreductase N-terminal domain-containing protein n=1 Tax=Schizophyllum amplum TaxID=97359 RepID=A0A550BWK3_9AGAR|nr:hypothetical protein BD626DRAFT_516853 [Auriculariopsis ampla]
MRCAVATVLCSAATSDSSAAADKAFDYIIAGGGLTGLVVANKLSAEGHSVLVIEAGPDSRGVEPIDVAPDRNNITAEQCNWKYDALAEDGSALSWKIDSGRCVGGSSSINGMVWFHPTKPEMDALEALGSKGWNWETLYPYMTAVETYHLPNDEQVADGASVDQAIHGYTGPVNVSFATPCAYLRASRFTRRPCRRSWTAWNDNSTGTNVIRRSSAAHGFLFAADQQRSSLTVLHDHKVLKINFDGNVKATGVQFGPATGGIIMTATANKEVLLAAGSLATPPILEHSGVGDKAILSQFGIQTVVDLPAVGRNLQDQPGTGASALVKDANATNTELIDNVNMFAPVISLVDVDQVFGDDSYKKSMELGFGLIQRAMDAVKAGAMESFQSAIAIFTAQSYLVLKDKMPVAEVVGESYPGVMTTVFWPLLPFSRGYIHINSSDLFAPVAITPRLLSDDFDLSVAVTIAKKARSMFTIAPFSSVISDPYVDLPEDASDDDWAAWYKETAYAASHWLGSSSMLPRALGGVVNNKLQVYGTKNLRVVDVSILPMPITCHTMPVACKWRDEFA